MALGAVLDGWSKPAGHRVRLGDPAPATSRARREAAHDFLHAMEGSRRIGGAFSTTPPSTTPSGQPSVTAAAASSSSGRQPPPTEPTTYAGRAMNGRSSHDRPWAIAPRTPLGSGPGARCLAVQTPGVSSREEGL